MHACRPIGIGPPLTGRPSHTTVRTGPYTAVRPVRQNRSHTGLQLPFWRAFGKHDAMGISATAAICPRVHNSYLPLPFTPAIRQAAQFGPFGGVSPPNFGSFPIPLVPAWRDFPRLICPLLTPAYTISAPCGLLTRWSVYLRILSFVFLS